MRGARLFRRSDDAAHVETRFIVDRTEDDSPGGEIDPRARRYPFAYLPEELPDFPVDRAALRRSGGRPRALGEPVRQFEAGDQTGHLLMTMTYAIKEGFAYERREAAGVQPPWVTLDRRKGSCRDFAVLMMEAARVLGFAARFVSG